MNLRQGEQKFVIIKMERTNESALPQLNNATAELANTHRVYFKQS